jgi:hypothetical protein
MRGSTQAARRNRWKKKLAPESVCWCSLVTKGCCSAACIVLRLLDEVWPAFGKCWSSIAAIASCYVQPTPVAPDSASCMNKNEHMDHAWQLFLLVDREGQCMPTSGRSEVNATPEDAVKLNSMIFWVVSLFSSIKCTDFGEGGRSVNEQARLKSVKASGALYSVVTLIRDPQNERVT